MKTTISKIKNTVAGINTGVDEEENQISDLEDKVETVPNQRRGEKKELKKKCG